jgi:hypothetical protein
MTRLLTKLVLGFSLAAGIIAAVPTASAQQRVAMTVDVPFAFTANNVSFAPGRYYVQASDHYLTLSNLSTDKTSFVIIRSDLGDINHGPTRLTFSRRDGQTYLKQVWTDGKSAHSELISHPKPRREIGQVMLPDATFEIATK